MKLIKKLKVNQRILNRKGAMPFPKRLIFEPTLKCNLHCSMCERFQKQSNQKIKDLELTEIKKLIEKLPKSIKDVYIGGGEPFTRKDIIDICKAFLRKGISVMIQTNGTFVDKTLELSKIKNIKITFSLDGPPKEHNKIRGRPFVYEKTVKILKEFRDQKKDFTITSVITNENIAALKELIKILYIEGLKPNFLIVELARRFTKDTIDETSQQLGLMQKDFPLHVKHNILPSYSYEEFEENMMKLDKELKKHSFKYCYYPRNLLDNLKEFYYRSYRKNNELYCSHLEELRIDREGNVIPCFVIRKSFGNIFEDSIENVWNSKEFSNFRIRLIKNNLSATCETCYRAENKNTVETFYKKILSHLYSNISRLKKGL